MNPIFNFFLESARKINNYYKPSVMSVDCLPPPLRLEPNYVWRSYRGGRLLRAFRGQTLAEDDHFPEDWLASTVRARNGANSQGPEEGISRVTFEGSERLLSELEVPGYFPQGEKAGLGVLLKLLDAADRLHIQAHPDDAFVQQRFGAPKGKTECWYVLSTRSAEASVLLGFQRPPSPREWERMILDQDISGMLECFDRIPVRPGDCLMVPAGVPHAIGEGIFMIELQQPSDWVVRCEFTVGDHTLPPEARFMGLELADCLGIFDFHAYTADSWRQRPRTLAKSSDSLEEEMIAPPHQKYFRLRRLRGNGPAAFDATEPAVLIVTKGGGTLRCGENRFPLRSGETFLLPSSPGRAAWQPASAEWEFLLAQSPKP